MEKMAQGSFVTSDGVLISFDDVGSGHPFVFIHGWAATRRFWHFQIERLSEQYRTVALDLRGHGDSQKQGDLDFSVERMAEDVRELIEHLQLDGFILVGHSLGGVVAARVSASSRSAGLVLLGTAGRIPSPASALIMRGLMKWRPLASRLITPRMFGPDPKQELLDFVRAESARSSTDVLASVLKKTAGEPLLAEGMEIDVPVLVVAGEKDSAIRPKAQRRLARMLGATYREVPGAGHNVMLERPDELGAILEQFARRVWRGQ